ncbi:MAG: hypothetical protein EOP38_07325 [Rubrivivax sp.]|nr:MAG: hypothetical protein EOP38_07325 [Rubrivivax sp.]
MTSSSFSSSAAMPSNGVPAASELDDHDHDVDAEYAQWRTQQIEAMDRDYQGWRRERVSAGLPAGLEAWLGQRRQDKATAHTSEPETSGVAGDQPHTARYRQGQATSDLALTETGGSTSVGLATSGSDESGHG